MFDITIIGGELCDGSGSPPAKCDVGIEGDRIRAVGDLAGTRAAVVIDAAGKLVCPGFIDAHSHSDTYLLIEPTAPSKIHQGITTEVLGNCGSSAAPVVGGYRMPSDWRDKAYPGEWHSVAEYRELLEQVRPAPNVVLLIGHNNIRAAVTGYENTKITASEVGEMKKLLEQSLDEGGRGLSSGLVYVPGIFATREELTELTKSVVKYGGVYASHMRSEAEHLLDSIHETVSVGVSAGVRVQISHLKISGKPNWGIVDEALSLIRKERQQGVDVAADRYPYTASYTQLDVIFPSWVADGGSNATMRRLRTPSDRARLGEELRGSKSDDYWATVTIAGTEHPDNTALRGMELSEVAERLGMSPVDAVLYLAESDELRTTAFFHGMSEDNMLKILGEPYVMIGTDASLRSPTGPLSADYPHPRAYGSFARYLKMVLKGKSVAIGEAVRKITSLPAAHFGLRNRGVIAEGMAADIVVLDPAEVSDEATYSCPHHFARGVEHVIINGKFTLREGSFTDSRAGRVL